MLGPDSRDKTGRSPKVPVIPPLRLRPPFAKASADQKAQAPLPDATEITQTCCQAAGLDRTTGDPERAQRNRYAGDSGAANPCPIAALNRIRRGTRGTPTAGRE